MTHISRDALQRFRQGGLTPDEIASAGAHLAECSECAALAREIAGAAHAAKQIRFATFDGEMHPSVEEDLYAYVDGTASAERRAEIEHHLDRCAACAQDVEDLRRVERAVRPRRQWWPLSVAAAVALAIFGTLLFTMREKTEVRRIPMRTLAVVPLRNASGNQQDEFLAIALADALTTRLQALHALEVRPTSAVLRSGAGTAGLGVDGLIRGRFLIAGNLVRVTLELIDTRSGASIWTESIEAPREDLLALVRDISDRTVNALHGDLVVSAGARSSVAKSANADAYEEYLKSRALQMSFSAAQVNAQIAHLQRAIALDPQFAAAYADLSIALEVGQSRGILSSADLGETSLRYAQEAVRLDPNLARAHLAFGRALRSNFPLRVHEVLTAVQLNDHDTQSLSILGSVLAATSDTARAKCVERALVRVDPHSNDVRTIGYWYMNAINVEETKRAARSAVAAKGSEVVGYDMLANAAIVSGDLAAADQYAAHVRAADPESYLAGSLDAALAAGRGQKKRAEDALHSFAGEAETNHWGALRQAICYARLGERNEAIRWMTHAIDLGDRSLATWTKHPWLQSLQHDPEFVKNVARVRADLNSVRADVLAASNAVCQ